MYIGEFLVLFEHVLLEHASLLYPPLSLGGKALAAPVAAAGEYVAAVFSAHALAEAVYLASVSFFGLISS